MSTTTSKTAPAAKSGQSRTIVAMFEIAENGFITLYLTLTPEFRARIRAAIKAAKAIDALIRVRIPDGSVQNIDFGRLPAATRERLDEMGIGADSDEDAKSIEFTIPKKYLRPTPKLRSSYNYGGYSIEVAGKRVPSFVFDDADYNWPRSAPVAAALFK